MLSFRSVRPSSLVLPIGLGLYFLIVAWEAMQAVLTGNIQRSMIFAVVAAMPILFGVVIRWPLIFPFGLYAMMVPLDTIFAINGGGTLTRLVGIVACGAMILRMLILRRAVAPPRAWVAWGMVVVWMAATTLWSVNQPDTIKTVNTIAGFFAIYTVASIYPLTRRELVVYLGLLVAVGVGLALYAFWAYQTGQRGADQRLALGNTDYSIDPNHFAANFLLPISIASMGFLAVRRPAIRFTLAGATILMGLGLILTGSRGALIAFGVMLAYIALRTRRWRESLFIAACGLATSLLYPTVYERFNDPSQGAASGRFYIWEVAKPGLVYQNRWIYGNGLYSFPVVYNRSLREIYQAQFPGYDRVGHNILVQSSVELGIIGVALLAYAWYQTWAADRDVPPGTPWFAVRVASEATVIGMLIMAFSIDLLWFKYFWLAITLAPLIRNGYAPRPLFSRRRSGVPARSVPREVRIVSTSSVSSSDFEQTSVAPEI